MSVLVCCLLHVASSFTAIHARCAHQHHWLKPEQVGSALTDGIGHQLLDRATAPPLIVLLACTVVTSCLVYCIELLHAPKSSSHRQKQECVVGNVALVKVKVIIEAWLEDLLAMAVPAY